MSKWTTADIPDQSRRIAIVTGANTGLGFETAEALAARGAHVVLAVRNLEKGKEAASRITAAHPGADVTLQELDLGSLESVRSAATALRSTYDHVDLLINNAGLMYPPKGTTTDGFELQFGTNHLGHFALTGLLIDRLLPVAGSRVVTVSSIGHRLNAAIHFDDLNWERSYNRVAAYGQSKLANLLFTYELQRRLAATDPAADGAATIAVAAHPGTSDTALVRHLPAFAQLGSRIAPSQGAAMGSLPTLRAATDPAVAGGDYYGPSGFGEFAGPPRLVRSSSRSHDEAAQRRLWAVSEELTGVTFAL
jgi:NAD(P)-dependent dehydrogenase (short-subunit alcohol dehydrogenase family)